MKVMRTYFPYWEKIREDFETSLKEFETEYRGTVIQNIPPQLFARLDKAIRKEKNWFDHGRWKYSRNTKLTSTYNPDSFCATFRLEAWRKEEVLQDFLRHKL